MRARTTEHPRPHRRQRRQLYAAGWAWTIAAAGMCGWLLATGHGVGDQATWLVLTIATGILANVTFELSPGRRPIWYCPDSQPAILAAIFLTPLGAMLTAIGPLADVADRREGVAWWKTVLRLGTAIVATGATAAATHSLLRHHPGPTQVLPVAIGASVVFEAIQALGYAVLFEARQRGGGRQFLGSLRAVSPVNVGINSLAIVLVAPFIDQPAVVAGLLAAFQAVTYVASRLSTSENRLRERSEHLHDMFARYVPAHVADQVAAAGERVRLGGEQREISVLFCDVRGFTTWSEQVAPDIVITELNSLLARLSESVMSTDGTLDKFTGDGLMAFWGAPLDQADHAELAVSAAIDMLVRLDAWNGDRAARQLPPFSIGIGIHCGQAVVGNVGHEARLEYTAIGDTVNTAARVESATKDLGTPLLITKQVQESLSTTQRSTCTAHGSITLKGREQAVEVFAPQPALWMALRRPDAA